MTQPLTESARESWFKFQSSLRGHSHHWCVTGAAGFIGSHLVESLLKLGQSVRGLDDFSTGKKSNLEAIKKSVSPDQWARFELTEGTVQDPQVANQACRGIDYVLHHAALASVPGSIESPEKYHAANVDGTLQIFLASARNQVKRVVFASSSAVYGTDTTLPKIEAQIGEPLSPYALHKRINEQYATLLQRCFGLSWVGLRYFNVYGSRQDPQGAYAAVIPRWIEHILRGVPCSIYGSGAHTRDYCSIEDVVQANLRAALSEQAHAVNQVYNIGAGVKTSLLELHDELCRSIQRQAGAMTPLPPPEMQAERSGDILHSVADISKAAKLLNYWPTVTLSQGLDQTSLWYRSRA